jgi:hypothetical protein
MTVTGDVKGDGPGDGHAGGQTAGDLPIADADGAPGRAERYGRFWALSGDSSDEEEVVSPVAESSERYGCIANNLSFNSTRQSRREEKRKMRRWAAKELAFSPTPRVKGFGALPSRATPGRSSPELKVPALDPSTFFLDKFDPKEWITVTRNSFRFTVFKIHFTCRGSVM